MKHIKAAWIEQILEFDEEQEIDAFLKQMDDKKQRYSIINRSGKVLRIRKQYNNNYFPKKEGDERADGLQ